VTLALLAGNADTLRTAEVQALTLQFATTTPFTADLLDESAAAKPWQRKFVTDGLRGTKNPNSTLSVTVPAARPVAGPVDGLKR